MSNEKTVPGSDPTPDALRDLDWAVRQLMEGRRNHPNLDPEWLAVKAIHLDELRRAFTGARAALGAQPPQPEPAPAGLPGAPGGRSGDSGASPDRGPSTLGGSPLPLREPSPQPCTDVHRVVNGVCENCGMRFPSERALEAAMDVFRANPAVWVNWDDDWLEQALVAAYKVDGLGAPAPSGERFTDLASDAEACESFTILRR